jgi:hypothetical protein
MKSHVADEGLNPPTVSSPLQGHGDAAVEDDRDCHATALINCTVGKNSAESHAAR